MEHTWLNKKESSQFTPSPFAGSPSENRVESHGNSVYFYSGVSPEKIFEFNKHLRDVKSKFHLNEMSRINVYIHSYGGSVFSGASAMDTIIETSKVVPVRTVVEGAAASAATFLSVVGTERVMQRHAYMLIHQLSSAFWGKYAEIKDEIENLDRLMEMIRSVYKEYTKVPKSQLDKILKRDIWFDAETCLNYGMIDKII